MNLTWIWRRDHFAFSDKSRLTMPISDQYSSLGDPTSKTTIKNAPATSQSHGLDLRSTIVIIASMVRLFRSAVPVLSGLSHTGNRRRPSQDIQYISEDIRVQGQGEVVGKNFTSFLLPPKRLPLSCQLISLKITCSKFHSKDIGNERKANL